MAKANLCLWQSSLRMPQRACPPPATGASEKSDVLTGQCEAQRCGSRTRIFLLASVWLLKVDRSWSQRVNTVWHRYLAFSIATPHVMRTTRLFQRLLANNWKALNIWGWRRRSTEAATLLRLSRHKTQHLPTILRPAARHAWVSRWAAHPSAAAMRSFACSLHLPSSTASNMEGPEPSHGDLTVHPHGPPMFLVLGPC